MSKYEGCFIPVDKTAALVANGDDKYKPNLKTNFETWGLPPETQKQPDNIEDLTGSRRGDMTIIKYFGVRRSGRNNVHSWLARCVCGRYEKRNAQMWRKASSKGVGDRCAYCLKLERSQSRDFFKRNGFYKD